MAFSIITKIFVLFAMLALTANGTQNLRVDASEHGARKLESAGKEQIAALAEMAVKLPIPRKIYEKWQQFKNSVAKST
ncbi:hypothetical protein PHMEG_00031046 [Phytophthora megakarya]|uniref:RxLR effector protein n=1 Tax=Phytophthora megakarya TaxID=4795 RepID=A0A225UYZ9_9STRA|nr:hypothetical protein PHMEG_00031046 [Phytophthora megakarya]